MPTRTAILIVIAVAAVAGVIDAYFESRGASTPRPVDFAVSLVLMVTGYLWYRRDSLAARFSGSVYLGGAVAFLSIIGIPYYLYRSRPKGSRFRPIMAFFGVFFAFMATGVTSLLVSGLLFG